MRYFTRTCVLQQSQNVQFNRLQLLILTDFLHLIAGQCVALVFCVGYADDLYTRQLEVRSRRPADVVAEKVAECTVVDVPIVR
jgi:hypothetical protein